MESCVRTQLCSRVHCTSVVCVCVCVCVCVLCVCVNACACVCVIVQLVKTYE